MLQAAQEDQATSEPMDSHRRRWRIIRLVLGLVYLVVLTVLIKTRGVPLDRIGITLWIFAGLTIAVLGKGWRAWGRMILDWTPFTLVMLAYDYAYGAVGHYAGNAFVEGAHNPFGFPLHVSSPVHADTWMFGGTLPNHWVQAHFYAPGQSHWYDAVAVLVYISHFMVTPVVAMVLWIVHRDKFRTWVGCVLTLAVAGVATYIVYPMAPPWMASEQGLSDPVQRITGIGWGRLGLDAAQRVLNDGQALFNPVAAMPSLHMGFATLTALYFMVGAPWWRKALLALYPLAMGTTLAYCGEHYVIDLLMGVLYAGLIILGWRLIHRWRLRRETPSPAPAQKETVEPE